MGVSGVVGVACCLLMLYIEMCFCCVVRCIVWCVLVDGCGRFVLPTVWRILIDWCRCVMWFVVGCCVSLCVVCWYVCVRYVLCVVDIRCLLLCVIVLSACCCRVLLLFGGIIVRCVCVYCLFVLCVGFVC